jgi:hypothetical protein
MIPKFRIFSALLALAIVLPATAATPDLFQVWKLPKAIWTLRTAEGKTPPLNAAGKALYERRLAARAAGKPIDDGVQSCLPHGYPRLLLSPFPFRIYQKPQFVAFVHELQHVHRIAYLGEQNEPAESLDPAYMGYPVANYDGDRLVVTSNGFNEKTTLDRSGLPHGAGLKLAESWRLIDGGRRLEVVITIDDAQYYEKTWTARVVYEKGDPRQQFAEYTCTDVNPEASMK